MLAEVPAWEAILDEDRPLIPGLVLDVVRDTYRNAKHLQQAVSVPVTTALLMVVPAAFFARINDVLLTALAVAVATWRRERREASDAPVLIDLEGHGREPMASGIDLSRTVGWFTSLYPVGLDVGGVELDEALAGGPAMGRVLKRIKEQLRAIPGRGLGYGLLRYLNTEAGPRLAGRPEPQLGFNYLGRFAAGESGDWSPAGEEVGIGGGADPALPLGHLVEVNALTMDGPGGPILSATWRWAGALLDEREVRGLAEGWRRRWRPWRAMWNSRGPGAHPVGLPAGGAVAGAGGAAGGVMPRSGRHPAAVAVAGGASVSRVYDDTTPDVYNVQISLKFEGMLDAGRLHGAAQALLDRHANLRASVCQERLTRPVQVIPRHVEVPWRELDLSALEGEAQDSAVRSCWRRTGRSGSFRRRVRCCAGRWCGWVRTATCWCWPTITC